MTHTTETVKTRLEEMVDVLGRLPGVKGPDIHPPDSVVRVQRQFPGIIERTFALGWEMGIKEYDIWGHPVYEMVPARVKMAPARPSAPEIDEAWETYGWFMFLKEPKDVEMLWDWAKGTPLYIIRDKYRRRTEGQIRYWRDCCVRVICEGLKQVA